MENAPLKFLSEQKLSELRAGIRGNLRRYEQGNFLDLEQDNGWAIEAADVTVDHDLLAKLDGSDRSASADIENSLILYEALKGMTPAMAREERIWVRLTHVECLKYSRARWFPKKKGEDLAKQVEDHMFAPTMTAIRDDNALSRLWWNMHVASIADPSDPEDALRLILTRADIRTSFVERTGTTMRRPLARAVVRAMRRDDWITEKEKNFREFMKVLNKFGGGLLFEALDDANADSLIDFCAVRAKGQIAKA